nr:class I SAM-dependent methyltransferase [Methylicorpusculum oleiharenae]
MYQDKDPKLVELRDRYEKANIAGLLNLYETKNVFDIGCGIGRWGWFFAEQFEKIDYLGIDFSSSLIGKAKQESMKLGFTNLRFQVMSAIEMQSEKLILYPPYDLILLSGLLIYLNDSDCLSVLKNAASFCAPGGKIYLREPVGIAKRVTLDKFYSIELSHEYSAIYRTIDELNSFYDVTLYSNNFIRKESGFLFPNEMEKRKETRQYFSIFQKGFS